MATAHINIGSNIGDRQALIGQAVAAVERAFGANACCSRPIESAPWGYDSPNPYINVGINIEVADIDPFEVLRRLQQAERSVASAPHRDGTGAYIDRPIDIDLIAIDSIVIDTPALTLPHPRMHLRPFVLLPMVQLSPDWKHPLLHATAARLLSLL